MLVAYHNRLPKWTPTTWGSGGRWQTGTPQGFWDTLFSAIDRRYIAKRHWARTILIDDCKIPTTKFDLNEEEKEKLWQSGVRAATAFMKKWREPEEGFKNWKRQYRSQIEEAQRLAAERYG